MINPKELFNLSGTSALILGGSSGIGKAIAEALLAHGADICIASIDKDNLQLTQDEFKNKYGQVCSIFTIDVTNESDIIHLKTKVDNLFSNKLNILVHSIGTTKRSPLSEITLSDWENIHQINSTSAFLVAQHFYPLLKEASFGRMINIASYFASHASKNRMSYAASKGSLLQFTRALAAEWAQDGITVNSISPGGFLTPLTEKLLEQPDVLASIENSIPMARLGRTDELMTTALFLTSKNSSYITGQDILVDGGWSIL